MGWKYGGGKRGKYWKDLQERFLKWMLGVEWGPPRYMVREERQREKLRGRTEIRAIGFEKRLEKGRESDQAKKCWEEMKVKRQKKEKYILMGGKTKRFFEKRGVKWNKMGKEGRDVEGLIKKEKKMQREVRRERIIKAKSNIEYKWIKREGVFAGIFEKRVKE